MLGAREVTHPLRGLVAFAEGPSLVPGIHMMSQLVLTPVPGVFLFLLSVGARCAHSAYPYIQAKHSDIQKEMNL